MENLFTKEQLEKVFQMKEPSEQEIKETKPDNSPDDMFNSLTEGPANQEFEETVKEISYEEESVPDIDLNDEKEISDIFGKVSIWAIEPKKEPSFTEEDVSTLDNENLTVKYQ